VCESGAASWNWFGVVVLVFVMVGASTESVLPSTGMGPTPSSSQTGLRFSISSGYDFYNQTYHLVNFDPLTGYVNSDPGFEYPTLSSDTGQAAGIYYVQNETGGKYPFVEQSLATDSVTTIAYIVPLYQKFASYKAMLDNEFFIESGYSVALFFGTTAPTTADYSLELVNLTTGYVYMWNTTSPTTPRNQQAQYLGNDIVAVISANGGIEGFNVSSRQSWNMYPAGLAFFEANNIYWVPQMHQLINVEADGASGDHIEVLGEGSGAEPVFSLEQTLQWSSAGHGVNGVDGIGFNASYSTGSPAIVFTALEGAVDSHLIFNVLLPYTDSALGPTNRLTLAGSNISSTCGGAGSAGLAIQTYAYSSNYYVCTVHNGAYPAAVWDPWNGSSLPTNITPLSSTCYNVCFEGLYAPSLSYLLNFNATAKLAGGPSNPPYIVVYDYLNRSEPYPRSPSWPLWLTVGVVTPTTIPLGWTNPPGLVLNNTVYSGTSCATYPTNRSLGSAGTSYTWTGLAPATSYCFAVSSWNATGQSPLSPGVLGTTLPMPAVGLTVSTYNETSISLAWSNPNGTIVNDTVFWNVNGCGTYSHAASAGTGSTAYTVSGLTPGVAYCFAVAAWSAGGSSALSSSVRQFTSQVPDAPTNLAIGQVTATTITISWTNPGGGGLVNDTVFWTRGICGYYTNGESLNGVGIDASLRGLTPGTTYCFAVAAWNSTGSSAFSDSISGTTSVVVAPPKTTVPPPSLWPPTFGIPNFNPFNWAGLAFVALGLVAVVRYNRVISGPVLVGAGMVLVFLIAV
jgi:uncharacterized protein (DUF2237 family)